MILILSSEEDLTTLKVIDWLLYWQIPFIRVNSSSRIVDLKYILTNENEDISFVFTDPSIGEDEIEFKLSMITCYWYRRGNFFMGGLENRTHSNIDVDNNTNWYKSLEMSNLNSRFHTLLQEKPNIGTYFHNSTNKISNLAVAKKNGLQIPDTLITNKRAYVKEFIINREIIQKCIGPVGYMPLSKGNFLAFYTRVIGLKEIEKTADSFFPSLFQTKLDKKYELRIFYLDTKTYTIAIFSQGDERTEVDFRNYNEETPNRTPCFELPHDIQLKIENLMKDLQMKSGSIDIVVTKKKEYIFLEVNPIGQFSQVSKPGGYNLEKVLANKLKTMYEERA